jgi:uncharacterized protein (DUF58 family)
VRIDCDEKIEMAQWVVDTADDSDRTAISRRWQRLSWVRHPLTVLSIVGATAVATALTFDPQAWAIASVSAAAIVVGMLWPRVSIASVSGELAPGSRYGIEGQPLPFRLQLRNRAPWSLFGLAFDVSSLSGDVSSPAELVGLEAIGAASEQRFEIQSLPRRRGLLPRRSPELATGFPFGLELRRTAVHAVDLAMIRPKTWPLVGFSTPRPLAAAQDGPESRQAGETGTTLGLRPYRRGDSPRDVHWQQTARCRELIVRERSGSETSRTKIVVDVTRLAVSGNDPDATLDWVVRGAASLADRLEADGVSAAIIVPGLRGMQTLRGDAALDALAEVGFDERAPSALFATAAPLINRSNPGWLVTTPTGFNRLTTAQRAASGWSFLLIDTGEHETNAMASAAGPTLLAAIPPRLPSESQPGDAFHVRRLA